MEKFRLKGIVYPGRVNLPGVGTVELALLPDEQVKKLWQEGCPYLELIDEVITTSGLTAKTSDFGKGKPPKKKVSR
jgi:hypothetical protein